MKSILGKLSVAALASLLFSVRVHAGAPLQDACLLHVSSQYTRVAAFGMVNLAHANDSEVTLGFAEGEAFSSIDENALIEFRDRENRGWFGRFGGMYFDTSKDQLNLYNGVWANGSQPPLAGAYKVWRVVDDRSPAPSDHVLAMVGDSLTWWNNGERFRCLLGQRLSDTLFVGSKTDIFGFGHEGAGGDQTVDVLARIDTIVTAPSYFLLIGTNDAKNRTPEQAISTIKQIVNGLLAKRPGALIMVSTLLPRFDQYRDFPLNLNAKIRDWVQSCGPECPIKLVELEKPFGAVVNPETDYISDRLHPTIAAYRKIVGIAAPQIAFYQRNHLRERK